MLKPCKTHDLYFYDNNEIPIEYIFYDNVNESNNIIIKENNIFAKSNNFEATITFLKSLGRKVDISDDTIVCNLKGIVDKKDIWLILTKTDKNCSAYLDDRGYGIVALLTNNFNYRFNANTLITEDEELVVNNNNMIIKFVKDPSINLFFELIKMK